MSKKNRKNQKGDAFLKNFTSDYISRMILSEKEFINGESIIDKKSMRDKLKEITENVNYIIQLLNLKVCRNIPYLSLRFSVELCDDTRIMMRNSMENCDIKLQIDDTMTNFVNITHLLDLYICAGQKQICNSNNDNINIEIVSDSMFKEIAIADIFLDIAVFNSFSFLKKMTIPAKKKFSKKKAEYYKNNNLASFFENEETVDLEYYSFAFSCHIENEDRIDFDIDKYLAIWNDFIEKYYPKQSHEEHSVEEQIEMRVDDHIPNDYYLKFKTMKPGIYFIFRINRKDIPTKRKISICNMFKMDNCSIGDLCIVNQKEAINYFDTYPEIFSELYIAVFKIVVQ